ncbi:MAG: RecQ family ATP-dependent DNA helicase [Flavobacteriales bacterium AspAUS03]
MSTPHQDLKCILKQYFGFDKFKGNQEKIIKSLLKGEDVFVIMPTGGGKSLCYQLPALISEGSAIVVSPLIALMKNQVDAIRGVSLDDGVAHVLNSSLNKSQIKKVVNDLLLGSTKLLYVAPETLSKEEYISLFKDIKISFFAIDEAHCISEWGHDFRPEYRNLQVIIERIATPPIIALTATATPKVQEDIQKNLGMDNAKVYKSSFNRPNLYYEVRPKVDVDRQIIKYIKEHSEQSGIVYCLSRKKVEKFSELLKINGINALPYHAGLDAKTRSKHQDMFLMQESDVIVATVAFGMGIDKPDVRYVIHYDLSKSLESYYQETGRAGRDGGVGECIAFYDYKDMEKLEKFMVNKSVAEREIGIQLLNEVIAYAETGMSRRKYLLHYFGESFDESIGEGSDMDDNVRYPKKKVEVKEELVQLLDLVKKTHQKLRAKELTHVLSGKVTALNKSYKFSEEAFFGCGAGKVDRFWMAVIRQAFVNRFLKKEIEGYGVLKLLPKGEKFIQSPYSFAIPQDHDYSNMPRKQESCTYGVSDVFDTQLFVLLKALREKIAQKLQIPPFAIFQETSLNDMAIQYPTSLVELTQIFGVGEGKAKKWGQEFVDLIKNYVEENEIVRPTDLFIKQVLNKSTHKVFIIQNVDRKLDLGDITKARGLTMEELISEMERIVYQGTKLNIDYHLENLLDEEQVEEVFDYFMTAESDKISKALKYFEESYTEEELRLIRIKFISEIAN